MLVRAKAQGYSGGKLREPGDEFEVAEGAKASWYEPVDAIAEEAGAATDPLAPAPAKPKAKPKAKASATKPAPSAGDGKAPAPGDPAT